MKPERTLTDADIEALTLAMRKALHRSLIRTLPQDRVSSGMLYCFGWVLMTCLLALVPFLLAGIGLLTI